MKINSESIVHGAILGFFGAPAIGLVLPITMVAGALVGAIIAVADDNTTKTKSVCPVCNYEMIKGIKHCMHCRWNYNKPTGAKNV
jgi:hypothetical protein